MSPASPPFKLRHVLHVPQIATNLLSVNRFAEDNDCVFVFDSRGFYIQDRASGRMLFQGLSNNGLYPFPTSLFSDPRTPVALLGIKTSTEVWHRRLGHPASSTFQKLSSALLLNGKISHTFCEYCKLAKSCKLSFPSSETFTTAPLEIIHSDVWGPSPMLSITGYKYYVVFVDDFSKYSWLFPMHCKSEVFCVSYFQVTS